MAAYCGGNWKNTFDEFFSLFTFYRQGPILNYNLLDSSENKSCTPTTLHDNPPGIVDLKLLCTDYDCKVQDHIELVANL